MSITISAYRSKILTLLPWSSSGSDGFALAKSQALTPVFSGAENQREVRAVVISGHSPDIYHYSGSALCEESPLFTD